MCICLLGLWSYCNETLDALKKYIFMHLKRFKKNAITVIWVFGLVYLKICVSYIIIHYLKLSTVHMIGTHCIKNTIWSQACDFDWKFFLNQNFDTRIYHLSPSLKEIVQYFKSTYLIDGYLTLSRWSVNSIYGQWPLVI